MSKYIIGAVILILCLVGAGLFLYFGSTLEIAGGDDHVAPNLAQAPRSSHGQFGQWYFFSENQLGVVVGWPGKPKEYDRPIWMIVIHYPKNDLQYNYNDKVNENGDQWEIDYTVVIKGLPNGGQWKGHYAVSSKQPVERFEANETAYSPEKGRVFLLDLARENPTVLQIPEDPRTFFNKPQSAADPRPELKEALQKIKDKYPEVRAFVEDGGD